MSDRDQASAGTPAFVRAPGHKASCDQEAALLIKHWDTIAAECNYYIQTVDGQIGLKAKSDYMAYRTHANAHMSTCNAENDENMRVNQTKVFSWVWFIMREVNTQEVSLKQQSMNIALEHFSRNTELN